MQANVLVEIKAKSMDNSFTYNVPNGMNINVGDKVIVPFGKRDLEGFVLEVGSINTDYKLKDIKSAKGNVLTEELIKLGKYMSRKTLCNLISCYQTMLPKALKASYKTNINKKYEVIVKLVDSSYIPRSNAQKELLERLKSTNLKKDLVSISLSAYKTLLKNNVIIEEKKEVYRLNSDIKKVDSKVELTLEQKKVVDSVLSCKNKFVPFLLHGVTGSGKTEFIKYLAANTRVDEKIITIEDTLELHLDKIFPNRDIVAMKTNNIASYSDVLVTCMRQNPKWILLSEVRSAEAVMAVRNSISSGHYILSTIHADKAASIPNRMYSLLETNQDIDQFLKSIYRYIQLGVYIRAYQDANTHRMIREIAEVTEFFVTEDNEAKYNTIYKKTPDGHVTRRNPSKYLYDYLEAQGVRMDKNIIIPTDEDDTTSSNETINNNNNIIFE